MKEMSNEPLPTREREWLLQETMKRLDEQYDAACKMLGNDREGHGVRVSAHYAVGLLARGGSRDRKRAEEILERLLELQFKGDSEDAFYGGFPRNDREGQPPSEPFPGKEFTAVHRYYLEKWQETIEEKFRGRLADSGYDNAQVKQICACYWQAVTETVPVVWRGFDPNWREFIGTDIAMILAFYEEDLESGLVWKLEQALERAVTGSLTRYHDHVCPMNTNIEMMHVLICAYLGERRKDGALLAHAVKAAQRLKTAYLEFHSVSEYNSSTYYSVDLMALSAWKRILKNEELRETASFLEAGIWKDITVMYHPLLKNLCGPFSRSYEMDMSLHSLLPALLYLGLGEEVQEKPAFNCELAGNIAIALLGTRIPEECREALSEFQGERQVETCFRELMERSHPQDDTSVCTASAWIGKNHMLGALRGSRNTSGQLRSATAYWKAPDGSVTNLALLRREPGENCEHLRTVFFHNKVVKDHMEINVSWDVQRDLELVFAVMGEGLKPEMFEENLWKLPGMTVCIKAVGDQRKIQEIEGGMEVIYSYPWKKEERESRAKFRLDFLPEDRGEKP